MRSTTPKSLQWFGLRERTKSFPFNLLPLLRKPFLPTESYKNEYHFLLQFWMKENDKW